LRLTQKRTLPRGFKLRAVGEREHPVSVIEKAPRTEKWGRVSFKNVPDIASYRDQWDLIKKFLDDPAMRE
jgi:hypothetical protein